MASIFPLVTFVRLRNVCDSIAQRDSNFSMKFFCKSESNCFPIAADSVTPPFIKSGELLGNYRVEKKRIPVLRCNLYSAGSAAARVFARPRQ
jgi:hypothetical protein